MAVPIFPRFELGPEPATAETEVSARISVELERATREGQDRYSFLRTLLGDCEDPVAELGINDVLAVLRASWGSPQECASALADMAPGELNASLGNPMLVDLVDTYANMASQENQ